MSGVMSTQVAMTEEQQDGVNNFLNEDTHACLNFTAVENNNECNEEVDEDERTKFTLVWRNLSYTVPSIRSPFICCNTTFKKKHVLNNMNGQISSGSITALMGPSGAGKTTLLNCISNKLQDKGLEGEVCFRSFSSLPDAVEAGSGTSEPNDIRIGFVPQQDHLFIQFSVKETLMFASKMNNNNLKTMKDHEKVVKTCLASLDLSHEADTKVWKLSGGQVKRTSIAVELISRPQILLLDEPTTGLDSDNSEKVIILLKNLTKSLKNPPAVIATIHQPSSDVFMMFDQIYLLNRFGGNIYSGPPAGTMSFLMAFDFERKHDVNPADYMIEVANAKYGSSRFKAMSEATRDSTSKEIKEYMASKSNAIKVIEIPLSSVKQKQSSSIFRQFLLLFWRSFEAYTTKSPVILAKIILGLGCGFLACNLSQEAIGSFDGCWSTMLNMTEVENMTVNEEKESLKDLFFDSLLNEKSGVSDTNFDLIQYMSKMREAAMYMLTLAMFHMFFYGMSGVLIFPFEFKIIQKEMTNNWYSVTAYYLSRVTCDAFLLALCVIPMITYCHYASLSPGGLTEISFWISMAILYVEACIWEARAQFFSIIFSKDIVTAIIFTVGLMFPNTFLSGLYIRVNDLKEFLQPFTVLSDMRYTFESLMLNVFAFDRCKGGQVVDGITNDILRDSSAVDIMTNVWQVIPVNHKDGAKMSRLLNLTSEDYLDDVIDGITSYLGSPPETVEDGLTYDPSFQSYQSSYMLSFFNFYEEDFIYNTSYLFLVMMVTKIAVFAALKVRAKVNRL